MSALAQCDAFAFIYDQAGDPAPDVLVVLRRVIDAGGNPILLGPKTTVTDSAGSFHFTLPELATAFISARASALWNCPEGRAFTVPPGPSGELVPDFSIPASTLVEPPLVYVSDVLSIPKASETQDGYLSAADYVAFLAGGGAEVGVTQINTGTGLTGGPITETGTIGMATIPGVAGTWLNPTSITVNAQGQIIAISATADTTAPVISAISATGITSSGATILWTTDDPSDSQVEYSTDMSYSSHTLPDSTLVTSHSVSITGTAAGTLYHYRVKSRNSASLLTTSGDSTFTTSAVVDTTPPVITVITATSITDIGATITWTTDELSNSQVEYGPTTSYGTSTTPDPTMVTSHSVPLTGLAAATPYHYRVKSINAVSLLTTSVDNTFTTAAGAANTLLTSLVAMWKLDEASGDRADSHSTHPMHVFATGVGSATGKIASGAHLLGDGSLLYADDVAALRTGDIDYTVAMWVKLDSKTAGGDIISKAGTGTSDEYIIGYDLAADRFRFTVQGGGTYTTCLSTSAGSPATGTWYFIVAWHDSSGSSLNIQVGTGTTLGAIDSFTPVPPLVAANLPLCLGYYGLAAANPLHGIVDEVAFWQGRKLDAPSRTALFNGGDGLPFSSWT